MADCWQPLRGHSGYWQLERAQPWAPDGSQAEMMKQQHKRSTGSESRGFKSRIQKDVFFSAKTPLNLSLIVIHLHVRDVILNCNHLHVRDVICAQQIKDQLLVAAIKKNPV